MTENESTINISKKKLRFNKTIARDVVIFAAGAGAAVATIAVLKKAPVLGVAAAIEDIAV